MEPFPAYSLACEGAKHASSRARLASSWGDGSFSGAIPADLLESEPANFWLQLALAFSQPRVSGFRVGAVAIAESGRAYLGSNFEYPGLPIQTALHAEQSACLLAHQEGDIRLKELWISAVPCGHCRQFLHEFSGSIPLKIRVYGDARLETDLDQLLPHAFSLERNTDCEPLPFDTGTFELPDPFPEHNGVIQTTLQKVMKRAHAPHSGAAEAVVLRLNNGKAYAAANVENAAFNPSVPAITAGFNRLNFSPNRCLPVQSCYFGYEAETKIDNISSTRLLLNSLAGASTWQAFKLPLPKPHSA